jgi:predicted DNA-binding transcriptional regulator YafY
MQALRTAIIARRSVRLTYRSFAQEETCRDVDPYALTFRGGLWYLLGFCHLRQEMRTFRVDRILAVSPLDNRFTLPRDFSVRDYFQQSPPFENKYTVVIHMGVEVAPAVREYVGHWADITEHDDGSLTVQFGVSGLDWATGWVLGYGHAAKVLAPPELVEKVQQEAIAIAQRYGRQ